MKGLFKDTEIDLQFEKLKKMDQRKMWLDTLSDEDVQNFILYLIQYEQLVSRGIDGNERILGTYSELTEQINPIKKQGDPYTLLDTGEFFKSMFVTPSLDGFVVDGNGKKQGNALVGGRISSVIVDLFELHGEDVVGLTEENKEELGLYLADKFIQNVKKLL
jgi:hypothetical protein